MNILSTFKCGKIKINSDAKNVKYVRTCKASSIHHAGKAPIGLLQRFLCSKFVLVISIEAVDPSL
jgi:hypothetical protein